MAALPVCPVSAKQVNALQLSLWIWMIIVKRLVRIASMKCAPFGTIQQTAGFWRMALKPTWWWSQSG